jgi:hypothetical protein
VVQAVPEDEAQDVAFSGPQAVHGFVHSSLEDFEAVAPSRYVAAFLNQAALEVPPPHRRSTVVGNDAAGDTEEPQPVLGRRRDGVETAPRNREHLGHQVTAVVLTHAPAQVPGYGISVVGEEPFERVRARRSPSPLRPAIRVHSV